MNGVDTGIDQNHQENVQEKIDYVFKVVVIGDSAVGKTQIQKHFNDLSPSLSQSILRFTTLQKTALNSFTPKSTTPFSFSPQT